MTSIVMVPLDERPVSTSLPAAIAAVAGVPVALPPAPCLPRQKIAGDLEALSAWLADRAADSEAVVVSLEGLAFGGLLGSRVGDEQVADVVPRWSVLSTLQVPVHASVVIPRAPDADDDWEEPRYWATHGRDLHALSAALDSGYGLAERRAAVPADIRADWLGRRLRQHVLALTAVGMAHRGELATLLVGVDDAAPVSLSALDQRAVADWSRRLELDDRLLVRPGTDEAGSVLAARAVAGAYGIQPRIAVTTAAPGGLDRIAPYETDPVGATARSLVHAAGAVVVEHGSDADAVLVVHAPDGAGDWAVDPPSATDAAAAGHTAELAAGLCSGDVPVGVADAAQPNGADPALVEALKERLPLVDLGAYAAWNTAGNTVGSAVAHLVAHVVGKRAATFDQRAHESLLARRLLEDWAYMSRARALLRRASNTDPTRHDHVGPAHASTVEKELQAGLGSLPGFESWRVVPGSTTFPWGRSFEIDLKVERIP